MGGGGAERTIANLLHAMAENGTQLSLLTLEAPNAPSAYPIPDIGVERLDLLGGSGLERLSKILERRRSIRRAIDRIDPDIVVSFLDTMNIAVLFAQSGNSRPIVISERTDPAHAPLPYWKQLLRRFVYSKANCLVVPTGRVAEFFQWMNPEKIEIIPNPTPSARRYASPDAPDAAGRYRLIAVGRLAEEKRFDLLIKSFGALADTFPDWDLEILGEGNQRPFLTSEIQRLDLDQRIMLTGWSEDIAEAYANAHLMVLSSRFEGFPNAMAEAAAAGLPLVGFAGVSGVEDIISDGKSGILAAPDLPYENLKSALETLMADATLRRNMGLEGRALSEIWSPDRVVEQWRTLFRELHTQTADAGPE